VNQAGEKHQNTNFQMFFNKFLEEAEAVDDYSDWNIVDYKEDKHYFETQDLRAAFAVLDKQFREYKAKNKGATIVVVLSPMENQELFDSGLRTMINEFPTVRLNPIASDSEFPALNWQLDTFRKQIERFINLKDWLIAMVKLSRYSLVPLGNIDQDQALSVIDNLSARSLSNQKHILWYSNTDEPDLGGHEDLNFRSYF
jgi:DNA polymerase epsilon subunit 1